VVILGASYAGGWKIDQIKGCSVINEGIDGNQSFEMASRYDADVVAHSPNYVLIWGFINDVFRSDPAKLDESLARIKESYVAIIEKSKQHGIKPILATEVTMREQAGFKNKIMGLIGKVLGKSSYQDFINGHVNDINGWLREYAAKESIPILDFAEVLAGSDGKRAEKYATDDGSHITSSAYDVLTEYVQNELK
jgi:lysophospholipase L1-like esterase